MKNPIPAVPTLHSRSNPLLSSKENVAIYLINFLFANPGDTSSFAEGEMISFRKLVATFGDRPRALADKISEMLTTAIQHYFPNDDITASCDFEEKDGTGDDGSYLGNYVISISFMNGNGEAIINRSQVTVGKDGRNPSFNFIK